MAKALWREIEGEPWLDNPRRRRRRTRGRKRSRKGRMPAALKAYWANKRRKRGGVTVARRRRRHRANPRAARRRHRRNPGGTFGRRNWMGSIMKGLKGGTGVVLGKAASRAIPTLLRLPRAGILGSAIQGLTGVLLAPVVQKFLGGEWGTAFLYGAFAAPIESLIVGMNVPILSPALSSYADEVSAIPNGVTTMGLPGFTSDEEDVVM